MQKKVTRPRAEAGTFRVSRKAMQNINAVEGIDLTGQIQREMEEFYRQGLTPEQRLAAIKAKFVKSSA